MHSPVVVCLCVLKCVFMCFLCLILVGHLLVCVCSYARVDISAHLCAFVCVCVCVCVFWCMCVCMLTWLLTDLFNGEIVFDKSGVYCVWAPCVFACCVVGCPCVCVCVCLLLFNRVGVCVVGCYVFGMCAFFVVDAVVFVVVMLFPCACV